MGAWIAMGCLLFIDHRLLFCLTAGAFYFSRTSSLTGNLSACQPDGSFSPDPEYGFWQLSGFFQITIPFGPLTFTHVKVIDIVWDMVSSTVADYPASI